MYDIVYYQFKCRIKILCLLCGLALQTVQIANAQNTQQIDSLTRLVDASEGRAKIDPLIALVRAYGVFDNKEALKYALMTSEIAGAMGDTSKYVMATRMVAQLYNRLSMYKRAEKILLDLKPIAERHNVRGEYKAILAQLAIVYTFDASYDKALETNFQALALREADQEFVEIAALRNNIGLVYFKIKNYQTALEFYNSSLHLKDSIGDTYDLDRVLINTGLCYNALRDYSKALEYFKKAFDACGKQCRDEILVEGNFGQGTSFYHLKQYREAEDRFKQSLEIAQKMGGYIRYQAENLLSLGRIYNSEKRYDEVPGVLLEAEKIAHENGYAQILIDIYQEFAKLYNTLNDFENASVYQQRYIGLKDSIYSATLMENLAKIQTDFAERQNIKTIADKEEVIRQQRNVTIAIVIIAILAALLVFVLYRSNQTKKKVNAALSEAKGIIEEQNKLLTSSNIILDKELKERNIDLEKANFSLRQVNEELDNFIYKTSHDIRGPLASLKGMCNVALIDVQDPVALDYLRKLDVTADKMNTILTRLVIVNQINNSVVGSEQIDFTEIINEVLLLEKKKGLPRDFMILRDVETDIEFNSDREFIRIILENLIDNAIKFYNDSGQVKPFVKISIRQEGQRLAIKVIDNGIGISKVDPVQIFHMFSRASERSETGGIGLYITKTAVQKLGGTIELKTNAEGHTEFSIWLPMQHAKVVA